MKVGTLLLVMPAGSGKSLCYQLPRLARGGTTLVISPLIALMEDQVARLKEQGFAVERIHSGRPRTDSRRACFDYLSGKLQFLFIATERRRVPGFPEMLAKRPLSLIAIDEAHCISQWGHDFRPDYRRLDLADGQKSCGSCDFCAPSQCAAQRFRTATGAEHTALLRVIAALRSGALKSTGKLYGELYPNSQMTRDGFEEVLGAMARAGIVRLSDAVFEKNGKAIPYRKDWPKPDDGACRPSVSSVIGR